LDQLASVIGSRGIRHYRIHGDSPRNAAVEPGIKLALMQDIKGFEFGHVFLTDLMDGYLIPEGMAWEERWRVAFQVYVAMTRARDELVMSFIFNRSILLAPLQDTVDEGLASDLLGQVLGSRGH
jgi:superfamily I DNA/RNA helicase